MTSRKPHISHTTKEGVQLFTEFWLYALLKSCSDLGTTDVLLRKIEEEAVSKFLNHEHIELGHVRDPEEVIRRYMHALGERGMMDERAVATRPAGAQVHVEIGRACPYRSVCEWANAEHLLERCFRAMAFTEILQRCTGRRYEGTLDAFGVPCKVTMSRSQLERHEVL